MMPNFRTVRLVRGRGGYGFTLSGQAPCCISWIAEESSAEEVGIRKGDYIVSVNGHNVYDASHEHVVKLIGMSTDVLNLDIQESKLGDDYSSSDDENLSAAAQFHSELHHNKRRIMAKPPYSGQSRTEENRFYDFNRTEQVLSELKSGALFQSVLSAIDANSFDVDSSTNSSKSSHSSRTRSRHKTRESNAKSPNMPNTKPHSNTNSMHRTKTRDHHTHKRNLSMPIESVSQANYSANSSNNVFVQSIVAYLGTVEMMILQQDDIPRSSLAAIEACVYQLRREQHIHQRVLLKVFQSSVKLYSADADVIAVYDGQQICYSSACPEDNRFFCIVTSHRNNQVRCHQFMVDPDICSHRNHLEKAKRFGIQCSMDTETGNCIEFPRSPRIILKMVEALFNSQDDKPVSGSETSQNNLIHTEENGEMISTTDSGIDGFNGSSVISQNPIQQFLGAKAKKKESASKLSQQNLKKHDMKSSNGATPQDGKVDRYMAGTTGLPPPMNRMAVGKYKAGAGTLPIQRGSSSTGSGTLNSQTQEVRQSKRGRKGNKSGEGLFFRVPKRSSSRQLRLNMKNVMSKSSESIPLSETGNLSGASSIESLNSNASLPSYFNGLGPALHNAEGGGRVANWAISFDRMLDDKMGLKYFTEFLRKEFSQENILFWLECERLQKVSPDDDRALKESSENIYHRFLSPQATSPVNIDSKGQRLSEEAITKPPHPNMFDQQQNQIYKLMKLDSYSRFLKSSLYRQCIMCDIEGLPLPLEPEAKETPNETHIESRHSFSLKHRKFFQRSNKSHKSQGSNDSIHRDSSDSESGFLEMANSTRPEDLSTMQQVGVDASLICRLVLWDNSSTVLYAEAGKASIREALTALCERRGVPLSAVDIYYQNEDRALALDQDISVLAGQEVRVERRTLFRLDMLPIGRSVGVKAKPTKSIEEVLKPVVSKYGLEFEDLHTTLSGETALLDISQSVNMLDGLRVCIDYTNTKPDIESKDKASKKTRKKIEQKNKFNGPANSDTEELISIMSAAQNSKMHDQRGLLSEMNLELPEFLKTPVPSPSKTPIPISVNSNNNNNQKEGMDLALHTNSNGYPLDVPMQKGGKLSPNPVSTGNAKARIQKLKHLGDGKPSLMDTPGDTRHFRRKTPSLDTDVSNVEPCDSDSISAVDDDPYVITKWMQSVSYTPKYPYAPDLDTTVTDSHSTSNEASDSVFDSDLQIESTHQSVIHDHRYTKRKIKGIIV